MVGSVETDGEVGGLGGVETDESGRRGCRVGVYVGECSERPGASGSAT